MSDAVRVSTDLLDAARAAPGFMPDDEGRALYEAARGLAVPGTTAAGAFFAKAAGTEAGAATDRRMTALRARFAR